MSCSKVLQNLFAYWKPIKLTLSKYRPCNLEQMIPFYTKLGKMLQFNGFKFRVAMNSPIAWPGACNRRSSVIFYSPCLGAMWRTINFWNVLWFDRYSLMIRIFCHDHLFCLWFCRSTKICVWICKYLLMFMFVFVAITHFVMNYCNDLWNSSFYSLFLFLRIFTWFF